MMAPEYIREATAEIKTPRQSVELAKSGKTHVPTVRRVARELGTAGMVSMVKAQMVELNIVLNLARQMNDSMINATAPLIVEHLLDDDCDVSLADLRIIFDRAKKGVYGDFYGGIGSADIIGWIDGYIAEKCAEFERWHQNEYSRPDPYERGGDDGRSIQHAAMVWYQQTQNNKNDKQ